jgi:hypothetical protein
MNSDNKIGVEVVKSFDNPYGNTAIVRMNCNGDISKKFIREIAEEYSVDEVIIRFNERRYKITYIKPIEVEEI